ncbi:NUDIX hydrolase [Streptomyces aidingensis]|uniref:8-oxo-dGTP diphosphatase n=1 Tax=Streptomyces aidingensis TaxID=910347 RepID=A0A1I1UW56_9ACTN|nr:NUDIX hydrolase [Streptomyces aidingensis]SFD73073.1 8-oxo-dGTP diphosphatase [Streptomyces aidingensis]
MTVPVDTDLLEALQRAADGDGIAKTVVGAVITREDDRVLLLHRPAEDYPGGLWELPSGGAEPGESLIDALRREVEEETGLRVSTVTDYLGHFDYLSRSGKKTRQFNFAVTVTGPEVKLTEHDAHEWADRPAQHRASPAVQTVLATWHHRAT